MAPYLKSNVLVILCPGRTFGAWEFRQTLINCNCKHIPLIAETQTILYTCRKLSNNHSSILELKSSVKISGFDKSSTNKILTLLPDCINKYLLPANSMLETSLGSVGMILHCLPVLLNAGWIENKETQFKYYYDGITLSICNLIEALDNERVQVAQAMGISIESLFQWLNSTYRAVGNSLFERLHNVKAYKTIDAPTSLNHRYITEDVPCGLVPIEELGKKIGLPMKLTTLTIDLASNILNCDFRKNGRNLDSLRLGNKSKEEIIGCFT